MSNLLISHNDLMKKLNEIEKLGTNLNLHLSLLTQEIKYIFSVIKSCETIESTQYLFDMLQKIQSTLIALISKDGISIKDSLMWFIYDFDRIDDKHIREYIFKSIKSNEYFFGQQHDQRLEIKPIKFSCCFCNHNIESSNTNPCDLSILTNWNKPKGKQNNQTFWCHLECFREKLHQNIQTHLVVDILGKNNEDFL